MSGASGSGKTTIILQSIYAHQNGYQFPIEYDGKNFAYIVADRSMEETQKKADKLKINVEVYGIVDDRTFKLSYLEEPRMALMEAMKRIKNPFDVLVIDPIMLFMKGSNIDYQSVAQSLIWMNRVAFDMDVTILGVHHSTKTRSDFKFMRPQDRISGSAAFQGFSGTQLALIGAGELEEPFDELHVVSHMNAPYKALLTRDDNGWFQVISNEKAQLAKLGTFAKFFGKADKGTNKELEQFAEGIGMSRSQLYRELNKFVNDDMIVKVGRGVYALSENKEE
jgi:KaiC/GvpD/RAD55 family RecA-like ATPase